jgi:hypothetical protein
VLGEIDWPCEATELFSETNLGLKRRVATGLTDVFAQVSDAIVLEDDCVPHDDFFDFCTALLQRYARNERVWTIGGGNFQRGRPRGDGAYYYSRYVQSWGWATWREKWNHFDLEMPFWPEFKRSAQWIERFRDPVERRYWERIFDQSYAGRMNSWLFPWTATVWRHDGLTATPNVNLVSNIGFGRGSTNTIVSYGGLAEMPTQGMSITHHPTRVDADEEADAYAFNYRYRGWTYRQPWRYIFSIRRLAGAVYRSLRNRLQ